MSTVLYFFFSGQPFWGQDVCVFINPDGTTGTYSIKLESIWVTFPLQGEWHVEYYLDLASRCKIGECDKFTF